VSIRIVGLQDSKCQTLGGDRGSARAWQCGTQGWGGNNAGLGGDPEALAQSPLGAVVSLSGAWLEMRIVHAGTLTRRHLDPAGRVIRVEQTLGAQVQVTLDSYDIKGRLLEHVDAEGVSTRFSHDLLGRMLRVERPESLQLAVFDASGNNVESRRGGTLVLRSFDPANRLIAVRHDNAAAAPVVSYLYHDNNAPAQAEAGLHTAGGRLGRVDDEAGSTIFDYDVRGQLASKRFSAPGQAELILRMAYRSDGLTDAITYPDDTSLHYHYDQSGRLDAIDGVIDAIDYDLAGNRTMLRYANGLVQRDDYDPLTQWRRQAELAGVGGTLRALSYQYDLVGNLLAQHCGDPALTWQYRYDDLYRLVDASAAAGDWQHGYDAVGNIVTNSMLGAYEYGGPGLAATCLRSAGADQFGYDERGMVASAPWGTHVNDAEGRLRRIDLVAGGHDEFIYGHSGRLVRQLQVDNGVATTLVASIPASREWPSDPAVQRWPAHHRSAPCRPERVAACGPCGVLGTDHRPRWRATAEPAVRSVSAGAGA